MKLIVKMMVLVLLGTFASCGEKEKPLYDQVMDIHDEVMPKMNDLYKLKKELQDSIANTPDLPEEIKRKFEQTILVLDSASNSMMVWMREFNPPDQKNKEAFQKYMESELVKVKAMREDVMRALEKVKDQN
jgi:predicted small lipoprotein YifL